MKVLKWNGLWKLSLPFSQRWQRVEVRWTIYLPCKRISSMPSAPAGHLEPLCTILNDRGRPLLNKRDASLSIGCLEWLVWKRNQGDEYPLICKTTQTLNNFTPSWAMFTRPEVINSASVLPGTLQFLASNLFRLCPSEDHFAAIALSLWITWRGPVLSPVELPRNTTYNKHSTLWLFCSQMSADIDCSTAFCSCLEMELK